MLYTKFHGHQSLGSEEGFLSSPHAGKRDIVLQYLFSPCIHAFVWICPDHSLYNNAWILKQFGTVFALEEQKYHLKHFR